MAMEEIKELDVDGIKVAVADLTAAQQRFVQVYQAANEKKVSLENEIITLNAAMRSLSSDLVTAIRADREAAANVAQMPASDAAPVDAAPVDAAPVDAAPVDAAPAA